MNSLILTNVANKMRFKIAVKQNTIKTSVVQIMVLSGPHFGSWFNKIPSWSSSSLVQTLVLVRLLQQLIQQNTILAFFHYIIVEIRIRCPELVKYSGKYLLVATGPHGLVFSTVWWWQFPEIKKKQIFNVVLISLQFKVIVSNKCSLI